MVDISGGSRDGDIYIVWANIGVPGVNTGPDIDGYMIRSEDGGESWQPRNKGVLVDFLPEKYPEVGQCVHHMESHPDKPEVLYQQNHCGCYRSDNARVDNNK